MAIDTVLLYDCETNGLDPDKDQVVEVAGLLWSVQHESTVSGFSFCVRAEHNDAQAVNGIPADMLLSHGVAQAEAWTRVQAWMGRADAVVAHNAGFDRSFARPHLSGVMRDKPWICTQDDVDWPRASKSQQLTDILLAHGLGISHAHRALVDVMNLARLFERVAELGLRPRPLLERAMRPKTRYRALVTFATNQLAKQAGFRWDPAMVYDGMRKPGGWWRRIAPEDLAGMKLRFEVVPS